MVLPMIGTRSHASEKHVDVDLTTQKHLIYNSSKCYNSNRENPMIYFSFNIQNPRSNKFKNLFCKTGRLIGNKFWEIGLYKDAVLFRLTIEINFRKDHGGIDIEIGFMGYSIGLQIYDNRHWDKTKDTWVKHETN